MSEIIIGIEGGGTSTITVVLDSKGNIRHRNVGNPTCWTLLGNAETCARLVNQIINVLKSLKYEGHEHINYLGMSLSGVDTVEAENMLREIMLKMWPSGIDHITVCNDTVGSLLTADEAGIVLISGTGSNCRLIHKDLSCNRVGGWGNLLGDEGSAFGIVNTGIKRMINSAEGFDPSPYDVSTFRAEVLQYFEIQNILDLIQIYYQNFDKTHLACFCIRISELARKGDKFCCSLFHDAGFSLGRFVATMARHCEKEILEKPDGLPVVCVGSVWKSWDLFKDGFLDGLRPKYPDLDVVIHRICLKQLTVTAAKGAAYLATDQGGHPLPRNYNDNCNVFYHGDL